MNVVDIMTTQPIVIRADQTLRDALELMERQSIKHLPVVSTQKHLIGILSDRDCRYALNSPFTAREHWKQDLNQVNRLSVRSIMTPAPIIVEPQVPAAEAARLMLMHKIGCLPVMRAETLIGIITRSDVLVAFMTMQRRYDAILDNGVPQHGLGAD